MKTALIEPPAEVKKRFAFPTLPWPEGTGAFALRTWLSLGLALYLAFVLELESASSAGVCVMLLAQPIQGMILSKSIYRTAGTVIGVIAAVGITSLFPQDRTMILAAFTLWMACCTAVATILRDFRAYGTVLAGYSVAIISIANIDAPASTFTAAVDRVAAILIGIVAIAIVNALFSGPQASRSLIAKLRGVTREVVAMARAALEKHEQPDPSACVAMSAKLIALRSQISFATPELPDGISRAEGARSALLGLFEMLSAIQAVGGGLARLTAPSPLLDEAKVVVQSALASQRPERWQPALETLATTGHEADRLENAFVLDRMRFLLETLADVRDGLRSVRTGRKPRRVVDVPLHRDYLSVLLNFIRVVLAIGVVCVLGVWSGLAAMSQAILFTAVYVSLGSINPNPSAMGTSAIIGLPVTVVVAGFYKFMVFPMIDGYPLFILSLVPIVLVTCYLQKIGQQGLGAVFGTMIIVLLAPANPQTLDPNVFLSDGVMFTLSGLMIFLSFLIVIPVQPAQRRLRLALAVGTTLRKALADKNRPARASLHYDRLGQFKQWLGDGPVTLARRKTLMRLSDLGNLSFAVRRAWRALDASDRFVPAALSARARAVLPTLSPDETEEVAQDYLALAKDRTPADGLLLLRAAAALHGAALVTNKEARLLRRVELLRRAI